jgi:hypothetical protein
VLLGLALLLARDPLPAAAKPEFALREAKACGYCHISPRGGGARNRAGVAYARNDFRFPPRKGDLSDFERPEDREAMIHARKMIDLQHISAAVTELQRLAKALKEGEARRVVVDELHRLDVKGGEILGQARLYLRGERDREGIELLVLLRSEYRGLRVYEQARADLKELRSNKTLRELIRAEEQEAAARRLYLDARKHALDGRKAKSEKLLEKLLSEHPDSRAAKLVRPAAGD